MQDTERKKSAMTKTLHESLIKEWHPDRNASFSIEDLTAGSKKKVWWLCAKGHTWEAAVYSRSAGAGCPYCAGNVVIPGENDLGTLYPQLAAQWHPAKNKAVRPDQIKAYSMPKIKPKSDYPLKTLYPRAFQTGQNHLIYYDFTTVE